MPMWLQRLFWDIHVAATKFLIVHPFVSVKSQDCWIGIKTHWANFWTMRNPCVSVFVVAVLLAAVAVAGPFFGGRSGSWYSGRSISGGTFAKTAGATYKYQTISSKATKATLRLLWVSCSHCSWKYGDWNRFAPLSFGKDLRSSLLGLKLFLMLWKISKIDYLSSESSNRWPKCCSHNLGNPKHAFKAFPRGNQTCRGKCPRWFRSS